MKEQIFSIAVLIVLISLLTFILPNGKITKIITPIFSLLILIVFISPLIKLKNEGFSSDFSFNSDEILYDENYIDLTEKLKISSLEKNCDKLILNLGVSNSKTEIYGNFDKDGKFIIKKVNVNLKNAVISGEKTHIVIIEEIEKDISDYLSVEKNLIKVYE